MVQWCAPCRLERVGRRLRNDREPQRAAHRTAQRLPAERIGGLPGSDDPRSRRQLRPRARSRRGCRDPGCRRRSRQRPRDGQAAPGRGRGRKETADGWGGRSASATMALGGADGLTAAMTAAVAIATSPPALRSHGPAGRCPRAAPSLRDRPRQVDPEARLRALRRRGAAVEQACASPLAARGLAKARDGRILPAGDPRTLISGEA